MPSKHYRPWNPDQVVLFPQAMSYGRMEGEVERLTREIREYAAKAVRVDAEEDELNGEGKEAHEIGGELRRPRAPEPGGASRSRRRLPPQ